MSKSAATWMWTMRKGKSSATAMRRATAASVSGSPSRSMAKSMCMPTSLASGAPWPALLGHPDLTNGQVTSKLHQRTRSPSTPSG